MKNLKNIIAALCIAWLTIIGNNTYAQTQNRSWVIPTSINSSYSLLNLQLIHFNQISTNVSTLSNSNGINLSCNNYNMQSYNSIQDVQGNLLFFVVGGVIYDKDGNYLFDIYDDLNSPYTSAGAEIVIVPVPGSCLQQYYIINVIDDRIIWGILDLSGASPIYNNTAYNINGCNTDPSNLLIDIHDHDHGEYDNYRLGLLAATKPISTPNSDRLLFISDGINIWESTIGNAINGISSPTYIGNTNGEESILVSEMEVWEDPYYSTNSNYKYLLAVPYEIGSASYLNIYEVLEDGSFYNSTGNPITIVLNESCTSCRNGELKGVEFSPNGQYIYVTRLTSPYIQCFNTNDGTVNSSFVTPINHAIDFNKSFIELGYDGKLYFAGNDGTTGDGKLATLDNPNTPGSQTWTHNAIQFPSGISIPQITYSDYIGDEYVFVLPDQVDQEVYNSAQNNTPFCCAYANPNKFDVVGNYDVTADATWNQAQNPWAHAGPIKVNGSITIKRGVTLTINNMEFQFTPRYSPIHEGSKVIIERSFDINGNYNNGNFIGGKLILDNTKFTSYDDCGKGMWEGVQVQGWTLSDHFWNQGKLYMQNYANIQNAYHGAAALKWTDPITENIDNDAWNFYGGVIRGTTKSYFQNNQYDVLIYNYPHFPSNFSYFKNCQFLTTQQLNDPYVSPTAHVKLMSTNIVDFDSDLFINLDNSGYSVQNAGTGIYSFDAGYTVHGSSPTFSQFVNLNYGINSTNSTPHSISIDKTGFYNNYNGIYHAGVDYGYITSNDIKIYYQGFSSYMMVWPPPYGIYLDYCKDFHVEANDLSTNIAGNPSPSLTAYGESYGIIVNQENPQRTCGQSDEIYHNHLHQLMIGCQAQGRNSENPSNAISYPCNINPNNPTYFYPNVTGLEFLCNIFTDDNLSIGDIGINDIAVTDFNSGTFGGNIGYDQGDASHPASNKFSQTYCGGTSTNYCLPPSLTPSNENDYAIDVTVSTQYNPYAVIAYANSCIDDNHNIPYCFTPLTPNMSPTKGVGFQSCGGVALYNNCDSKLPVFPSSATIGCAGCRLQADAFIASIATEMAKTTPDYSLISYYEGQKNYYVEEDIRTYLAHDTLSGMMDSVIADINNYALPNANYEVTKAYLAIGDTVKAKNMISTIESIEGKSSFTMFMQALIALNGLPNKYLDLKNDSTLLSIVQTVAIDTASPVFRSAQGLLDYVTNTKYKEWIQPPTLSGGSRLENKKNNSKTSSSFFNLYPNPTENSVTISYSLPNSETSATINIYNSIGDEVKTILLTGQNNIMTIDISSLANGIYNYQVKTTTTKITRDKLIIIK